MGGVGDGMVGRRHSVIVNLIAIGLVIGAFLTIPTFVGPTLPALNRLAAQAYAAVFVAAVWLVMMTRPVPPLPPRTRKLDNGVRRFCVSLGVRTRGERLRMKTCLICDDHAMMREALPGGRSAGRTPPSSRPSTTPPPGPPPWPGRT